MAHGDVIFAVAGHQVGCQGNDFGFAFALARGEGGWAELVVGEGAGGSEGDFHGANNIS
jgi:hypothetical protein